MAINATGHIRNMRNGKNDYEHRRVWCAQPENLSYIPKGFVVHHINGSPSDNRADNLILLPAGFHTSLHNKIRIAENPELKFFGINARSLK